MLLQLFQKMNYSIFLLILFQGKKQQKHIRKRNPLVKYNISLLYQHQVAWETPFNYQVDSFFFFKLNFIFFFLDGQIIQLPQNLSSNIVTMAVSSLLNLFHKSSNLLFLESTRYSTTIYNWTLNINSISVQCSDILLFSV